MLNAAGPAAALKGLGSTPLRTRHRPTGPTDSPDKDSGGSVALKRAQGAPQRPYSGSLGFPRAGRGWGGGAYQYRKFKHAGVAGGGAGAVRMVYHARVDC